MALIKHSERSPREAKEAGEGVGGCKYCGSLDVYWYHDTEGSQHGRPCKDHEYQRNWILVERNGVTRHQCRKDGSKAHSEPEATPEAKPGVDHAGTPIPVPAAPVTAPAATPVANDSRLAAIGALLDELAPKVDASQVHAIVDERLRGLVLPVQVEVKRDGIVRKVEGLAHNMLPVVISLLDDGEHVMMVGPAGTGKSHLAHQAADALGLEFYSISLTAQIPTSAITGYMSATGDYIGTAFRQAYEHGGVFLYDEVDNGNANALGVVNSALANGSMAFPDGMVKRHSDFRCVASANTYGRGPDRVYAGRQQLDGAFMDRFEVIDVEYDEALEEALCMATGLDGTRVKGCLAYVRHLRARADEYKMPLVFSPRRSRALCKRLASGMTASQAVQISVRRGISDTDWRKVSDGAPRI